MSANERESIRQLASDIPFLWSSSTTTIKERQEIIRLLIERIIVTVQGKTEKVSVEIHWSGGHISHTHLIRPIAKTEQLSYYDDLLKRIEVLRKENKNLKQIASILNDEGWRSDKWQQPFNVTMVSTLLVRTGMRSRKKFWSLAS